MVDLYPLNSSRLGRRLFVAERIVCQAAGFPTQQSSRDLLDVRDARCQKQHLRQRKGSARWRVSRWLEIRFARYFVLVDAHTIDKGEPVGWRRRGMSRTRDVGFVMRGFDTSVRSQRRALFFFHKCFDEIAMGRLARLIDRSGGEVASCVK